MESIPDSVVGFLLNNLKDFIVYNAGLISSADEIPNELWRDMEQLKAFVKHCTEKNKGNEYLETLVNSIRDTIYDAEDIIEDYVVSSVRKTDLLKRRSLGKELEKIRTKLQSLYQKEMPIAREEIRAEQSTRAAGKKKKIYTAEQDTVVVGFEDETDKVIQLLSGESKEMEAISITGMLGLGKTTLAKKVYNDPRVEYKFFRQAFVNVSQQYKRKEVFLKILGAFTDITVEMLSLPDELIVQKIHEQLKNAQYLIVLDDVWTPEAWDDLKVAFPNNELQSRVLITSRYTVVATRANPSKEPHPLRFLRPEESHELLQRKVFGENDCPKGLEIYKKLIVEKCGGLPLALVVIAGILQNHPGRIDWWKKVAESASDRIAKLDESKELMQLSLNHLPYHLKPCFLYLGLFPEDFEIPVWKLLRLWIAEGFIEGSWDETLEDTAEIYLDELINRNLVIVEQRRLNGHIKTCSVHDALREFCRIEGMKQNLFHEIKRFDPVEHHSYDHFRRICINSNVSGYVASKPFGKKIRSFLGFATKEQITLEAKQLSRILDAFTLLRILDVRSIKFQSVPSELYYLVILKYMAVSCEWDTLPRKLSKLWNLQTLIIETSRRTLAVKANIWKLARLRHIHTNASASLEEIKEETSVKSNLQTLSTISPESCTRATFEKTPHLKKLGICGKLAAYMEPLSGPTLFDNLVSLESLENLKLVNSDVNAKLHYLPDEKKFPHQVTRLTLSNTFLAWKHMSTLGKLENLEVLKLKNNAFEGDKWATRDDDCFPRLKVLHIESTNLLDWTAKASNFPALTTLIIKHCSRLLAIPRDLAQITSLERIVLHWTPSAVGSAREIQVLKLQLENIKKTKSGGFKLEVYPPEK